MTQRFGAKTAALTDSGTSALVGALRLATAPGQTVAYPAYVCVDLIAAAHLAGVQVRLYDVDPRTLSPDLASLRRVLAEGVNAVVVANLYGFPVDMDGVREILAEQPEAIPLIEDAAQRAGATWRGSHQMLGDLTVLSFGRGKGTTAGNGGALLAREGPWVTGVNEFAQRLIPPGRGIGDWIGASASWALGRPELYDIPAHIPALHLGETVYHDAHEPRAMSHSAVALLHTNIQDAEIIAERRERAAVLRSAADEASHLSACDPVKGGEAGYLRFPVVTAQGLPPAPLLGIVRGYPRPLIEQPELHPILHPTREPLTGARELANHLMTLPTHHFVTPRDLDALCAWLRPSMRAA